MTLTHEQIAAAVEVAEAMHAEGERNSAIEDAKQRMELATSPDEFRAAKDDLARFNSSTAFLETFNRRVKARKAWAAVRPA